MQGGNPSVLYQNFPLPPSSHRLLLHSAQPSGQPNVPYNGYSQQIQYPQQTYGTNNSYNTVSPSASMTLHYPPLPPQQTSLSTSASLTSYPNLEGPGIHVQSQVSLEIIQVFK